jgi:hypothetical protein
MCKQIPASRRIPEEPSMRGAWAHATGKAATVQPTAKIGIGA